MDGHKSTLNKYYFHPALLQKILNLSENFIFALFELWVKAKTC